MAISRKAVLAAVAGATLLAGCATGPYYYDDYGYADGYGTTYGQGYVDPYYGYGAPYYDAPGYYYGPSIGLGLGFTYSDRDYRRYGDHRHRHWRRDGRDGERWRHGDRGRSSDGVQQGGDG